MIELARLGIKYVGAVGLFKTLMAVVLRGRLRVEVGDVYVDVRIRRKYGPWLLKNVLRAADAGLKVRGVNELACCGLSFPPNYDGLLGFSGAVGLVRRGFMIDGERLVLHNGCQILFPRDDLTSLSVLRATFADEEWGFLNVSGRVVLDVGAFVGDTPIYFIMRGARRVIAYEPHPVLYQYLVRNVRNCLESVIETRNQAIWSVRTKLRFKAVGETMLSKVDGEGDVLVDAVELPLVGDVLKMDCEGCEHVLLGIDPRGLPFVEVGLEYHGSPKPLIRHLETGGYRVRIIKKGAKGGLIHAYK